jgi:hypothetical protein
VHGAWAQNIGVKETYIDFMGDKGGIRLDYGGKFTYYSVDENNEPVLLSAPVQHEQHV